MSEPEPEAEDSPRDPDLENLQVVLQRLAISPRPVLADSSTTAAGSGDTGLNLSGVRLRLPNSRCGWVIRQYPRPVLDALRDLSALLNRRSILAANQYQFVGLRFRRVSSLVEGRDLYLREAERQGVDPIHADAVFWWE